MTLAMSPLTTFGALAVTVMLISYTLERRSSWWVLVFALACGASSLYGWLLRRMAVWGGRSRLGGGGAPPLAPATHR